MKILVLAPHAFYIDRGTPIDVDILVRAMSERGDEIEVACYHEGVDRDYPGVTIHRIHPPRLLSDIRPGFSLRKLLADVYLAALAWKRVRLRRPDVIHAGEEAAFIAMALEWLYRIPFVYDMDSSIAQQMVEKMGFLRPIAGLLDWLEARAIRAAIATAPVCHALADLARDRGARHIETLHDISQLADPDRKPTGFLKRDLGIDGPILMYVGNLEKYQGVDLLLEAFAIARQRAAELDLVVAGGDDDDIAACRAKAVDLGIADRTHFLGRWPAAKLDELLVEADILTAPRIKGVNTPMKIFPYLHTGRPVLVTDLPTHSQILTPELAMLAPPEPQGFAGAIERLAGDAELRASLGAAGRAFVERNHVFDEHRLRVDRLYRHVEAALKGDAPAEPAPADRTTT